MIRIEEIISLEHECFLEKIVKYVDCINRYHSYCLIKPKQIVNLYYVNNHIDIKNLEEYNKK